MCQLIGYLISYTSYGMCKRPIPHSFQIQKVRFKLINKTISNRKVLHTCKRVCNIFCCGRPHKNISLSDNITSGIKLSSSTGRCPPSLIIPKSICSSAQIFFRNKILQFFPLRSLRDMVSCRAGVIIGFHTPP